MAPTQQEVLPHAEYYKRQGFPLKKIVEFASNRGFTDLMVFNEDHKEVGAGGREWSRSIEWK